MEGDAVYNDNLDLLNKVTVSLLFKKRGTVNNKPWGLLAQNLVVAPSQQVAVSTRQLSA
jgi:hypothetical protein